MLREKDFITEVHSINGEGEDEGVVYSEMESAQNTYEDINSRKVASLLYGTSAYISTLPCQTFLHLTLPTLVVTLRTSGS